jgi:phytanoyl-CoA hydroxylase
MRTAETTYMEQMDELGFVVIRDLLDPAQDLHTVIDEYITLLDDLTTRWLAEGKLNSAYKNLPFEHRLTEVFRESQQPYHQEFDISLPQDAITEETPIHLGRSIFNLLRSPRLLDAVEIFIGPEIYSNPVQHVRIKLPESLVPEEMRHPLTAKTQWHQDMGVVDSEADRSQILSVWIPLTKATVENGCLVVVPGSHKGELAAHCRLEDYKGLYGIPERYIGGNQVPVPMEPGDAMFFFSKLKHASLPNISDEIRWSFDLRYNPIGQPTGRPWFPGFVARSRVNPASELRDPEVWAQLWRETRATLAKGDIPSFNRWSSGDPRCA